MKEHGKINIVFAGRYNESEILSGPEKVAKRLFNEHTRNAPSVFIEYFFDGSRYSYWKKLFGQEIIEKNSESKIIRAGLIRLLTLLFQYEPDILHIINYERFAVVLLLYKLFAKVKIVYNAHGIIAYENSSVRKVPFFYNIKDWVCEKLYFRYSDKIIFYSEASLDLAEKYFKIDESKVVILASGIDKPFHDVLCNRRNGNHTELRVVLMNNSEFITKESRLLKEIIGQIKNLVEINLIGKGINGLLNNGNGKVNIRFIEKMDTNRLAEFYRDKDVYLSLTAYETFSIAAVEAMAAGLIPIVSKGTGMSRYISEGENGYALENFTASSIAGCINLIAENQRLKSEISANSAKIYEFLHWKDVYDTFSRIYLVLEQK